MNPISILQMFLGPGMFRHTINISILAIICWIALKQFPEYSFLGYPLWISLIIVATIIIWRAGDFFEPAAEFIQKRRQLPESVKAAVIDAIASSFPEFCVAVIAVIMLGRAEVGISSIVGSALYNVLVIPAAAGLIAKTPMTINREVIWRDNMYYFGVVLLLLAALVFPQFSVDVENPEPNTQYWGIMVAVVLLCAYFVYVLMLHHSFKKYKEQHVHDETMLETVVESKQEEYEEEGVKITTEKQAWFWIIGMMLVMGGASHVLVEASLHLGELAGIDAVIMGFVVIAAGTSVPDTVLSVISAQEGNYDAAISNVFGSNIFDICVCLSIPILIAMAMGGGPTPIVLPQVELIWSLIGATLLAFYFFRSGYTLSKPESVILGGVYILIVVLSFTF